MFVLIYLTERRGIMTSVLIGKMESLLKERVILENKLNGTSNLFSKKRNMLGKFISEIDRDIEILECDISNLRSRLIRLGFNPDVSFEDKSIEEIGKEYDLLMKIGIDLAPELGTLGIEYAINDKKELLALSLLDMFYIGNLNMTRLNSRKVKARRI